MGAPAETERSRRWRELSEENERLRRENDRLRRDAERWKQENERLQKELEAALRRTKRQAAPFSKGEPKPDPKPPGRKAGRMYGRRSCRPIPQRIDEQIPVPAPRHCLRCGGAVRLQRVEPQYQEEMVRLTAVRRFDVEVGHGPRCGAHAQGRHPLQTSDALGAARVQLGPEALALGAHLNKQVGLLLGQTTQVLPLGFGLQVSRAGIYRALARMAGKAAPTYEQWIGTARQSLVNWMDEMGWRAGGRSQWLWVAVSEEVTVYAILPAVVARKVWGGNRTWNGARTQQILASVLRTCRQQGKDGFAGIVELLRWPAPGILDIVPGGRSP